MTNPTTPAGWYQDPTDGTHTRWWDGTQWTDHVQQAYTPAAQATALSAPVGTRPYTPWIWLMVFLPYLTLPLLFTFNIAGMYSGFDLNDPASANRAQVEMMTSPSYIALTLGGFVIYGLCVVFAFLDHKEIVKRGIPRPFHWAWTFLSSPAYVIGRSVIVRRRTGLGIAPMWVAIGMLVLSLIISFAWLAVTLSQIVQQISMQ